jgi:hypothetical protein
MKTDFIARVSLLVLMMAWVVPLLVMAAEHGGAGMKEHEGTAVEAAEPAPEALRQTIRDHIANQEKEKGAFTVVDERTGEIRQLELVQVHERVGKTGDFYYSCTDMKDVQTGDLLDLDFDVQGGGGDLKIVAVRIHKDNGTPRYTYDANDQRIPVQS